ncbi:MAG: hypothetical protein WAU78_06785 [Roseiarcus sp.]|jgi:hypothetical protein
MIFTVPIVGKILAGFAASEVGAAPAAQATDPQNASGAADPVDFAKAVDDLDRAAAAIMAQHGAHGAVKS